MSFSMISQEGDCQRCYCDGEITKADLANQLKAGFVVTSAVRRGHSGGDVVYFRKGTAAELAQCRAQMMAHSPELFTEYAAPPSAATDSEGRG